MMALRWSLGTIAAVCGAGWVLLALWAEGFRRSFGASGVGTLKLVVPPAVLALVLATVLMPSNRWLLHACAVVFALVAAGLVFVLRESLFVGIVGLAFFAAWFVFWWRALWP